jgi:hypothetical protein
MKTWRLNFYYHRYILAFLAVLMAISCGGSRDETISGVTIPVPRAMKKSAEKPVEFSLLGFGAGQAFFHGKMDTNKLIDFYKQEMPARGWEPSMNLMSGGAMLAYSKAGKSIMIGIGKQNDETVLSLTVGGVGK